MNVSSKLRAGIATAALAVVVVGGVAVASSGSGDRPTLEQSTVGGETDQVEVTTTTVAPVETTGPVETTVPPETTVAPTTTAAPAPTSPPVQMVTVPPVIGLQESTARQSLTDLGFQVEVTYGSDPLLGREVLSVSPGTGTPVEKGGTIVITVSCDCG